MPVKIGVPREQHPDERRVALDPGAVDRFVKLGAEVLIERDAGASSCLADQNFENARIIDDAESVYTEADIILKVQPPTENEIDLMHDGVVLVGFQLSLSFSGTYCAPARRASEVLAWK